LKRYTVQSFGGFGLSLTKEYAKEKTITTNVTIRNLKRYFSDQRIRQRRNDNDKCNHSKFKKIKEKERESQGHNLVFE